MLPDLTAYHWIVVNSSAGKDSQAMLDYVVEQGDRAGVPRDRLVVVHADLGRVEWPGTRELAEEQARHYGLAFVTVRRRQGDLLDHIAQRGMFPSPRARFCTSDHKRTPVAASRPLGSDPPAQLPGAPRPGEPGAGEAEPLCPRRPGQQRQAGGGRVAAAARLDRGPGLGTHPGQWGAAPPGLRPGHAAAVVLLLHLLAPLGPAPGRQAQPRAARPVRRGRAADRSLVPSGAAPGLDPAGPDRGRRARADLRLGHVTPWDRSSCPPCLSTNAGCAASPSTGRPTSRSAPPTTTWTSCPTTPSPRRSWSGTTTAARTRRPAGGSASSAAACSRAWPSSPTRATTACSPPSSPAGPPTPWSWAVSSCWAGCPATARAGCWAAASACSAARAWPAWSRSPTPAAGSTATASPSSPDTSARSTRRTTACTWGAARRAR